MKIIRAIFFILGFGVIAYSAFAADQIKTTEHLVGSSDVSLITATSTGFSFYVGDNLSGTDPVKSLYFTISGVYTGNGTLGATINSDAATLQSFTLPDVGSTPTPFELIYKDPINKINPQSAGAYNYVLDVAPSGITVYGLGIKMTESHRYAPPACVDGSPSNEKVKTTTHFVGSSDVSLSTATSTGFSFYIGDNLSGITNPVKSLYFTISGVYTSGGGATIGAKINGDTATLQTFNFPSVGPTPTPFELIYKDPTNKINPQSAGNYNYILDLNLVGILVYNLGVTMTESHQYKPPPCAGMPAFGDLTSAVFDSTGSADGAGYNSVMWKGTLGGPGVNEGKVKFQFSASDASTGPWTYIGGDLCSSGDWFDATTPGTPVELKGEACQTAWNNKQYFRYKVRICSNNCTDAGTYTPTVEDVVVNWAP
ncbi:MAG: hypothetical protein UY07_C0020G0010 [Parcubacteria group bacterium GW2011_GWA1_47_8]|nr:MAG: hypothetical protein UY07_C0020G0010 [Parcubacteria group bacterium GW2011_GWA1_47_8]